MDLSWIKAHKGVVALFGAATVGAVAYTFLHKGNHGTASGVMGGNAIQGGSPQYLVPVVESAGGSNVTPSQVPTTTNVGPTAVAPTAGAWPGGTPSGPPLWRVPTPSGPAPATNPINPGAVSSVAANPYGVGTSVMQGEQITQSVYDPAYNGWVNLTSKGGIYTSPGFNVSGSAFSPQWKGNGRIALNAAGTAVQEYNPSGQLVGSYAIGK